MSWVLGMFGGIGSALAVWILQWRQERERDRRAVMVLAGELRILLDQLNDRLQAYENDDGLVGMYSDSPHGRDLTRRWRTLSSPELLHQLRATYDHADGNRDRLAAVHDDEARKSLQSALLVSLPSLMRRVEGAEEGKRENQGPSSFLPEERDFRDLVGVISGALVRLDRQAARSRWSR